MASPGLSYEQAPPFGTPLRLFLAAPLFLILAAALAAASPESWLQSRWTPHALAITHLLTLGYLGMVMAGAFLQMLPVVIGSPVPGASLIGHFALAGLGGGAALLATGFLLSEPNLLILATLALAIGLTPFLAGTAISLARAQALPTVAWPMRQAWLALLVTVALGMGLATGLAGLWPVADPIGLTDLHAAWGLGGWILILVIGVAYQVVPMLQLTPPYPAGVIRILTWSMPGVLLLFTLAYALPEPVSGMLALLAWGVGSLSAAGFALATLGLQRRRRRKLSDITLDFWRLGMASLILVALLAPAALMESNPWQEATQLAMGIVFLLGFTASVVNGMIYKIVPFLGWFHLQSQTQAKAGSIPNMKQFITENAARRHYRLHLAAVVLLLPCPLLPPLAAIPGLALLAASGVVLGLNLIQARRIFLTHGGRL
jgi:hypothetical protein